MSNQIPLHDITPRPGEGSETVELYAAREKIHTRAFKGLFRNLRMAGGALLLLIFFGTVWLTRNGHQAVWWNLPERKFYIFGATFWPQDFILLSGILIVAAFGCFLSRSMPDVSGADTPARRASGPGCSCGAKKSPRATATSASGSTMLR